MRKLPLLFALATCVLAALPAGAAAAPAGDRNRSGIPDSWEKRFGLSVVKSQAATDRDRDGLGAWCEFRAGTSPRSANTDRDRTPDADEDRDRDGVDNGNECRERTLPDRTDTDGDRRWDGREDADGDGLDNATEDDTGNDPADRDSDDDGVNDGAEHAGRVVFVRAGVVTLRIRGARLLRARVTHETRVVCVDEDDAFEDLDGEGAAAILSRAPEKGPDGGDRPGDEPDDGGEGPGEPGDGDEAGDPEDDGGGWEDELGDDMPGDGDGDGFADEAGDDEPAACGVENLVRGTPVRSAVLRLGAQGAVLVEIEILP